MAHWNPRTNKTAWLSGSRTWQIRSMLWFVRWRQRRVASRSRWMRWWSSVCPRDSSRIRLMSALRSTKSSTYGRSTLPKLASLSFKLQINWNEDFSYNWQVRDFSSVIFHKATFYTLASKLTWPELDWKRASWGRVEWLWWWPLSCWRVIDEYVWTFPDAWIESLNFNGHCRWLLAWQDFVYMYIFYCFETLVCRNRV